jgi:hypothetical protein
MARQWTDTERLDFLIANTANWVPPVKLMEVVVYGGCWNDGDQLGVDDITPGRHTDPRSAIDAALTEIEEKQQHGETVNSAVSSGLLVLPPVKD